MHIASDSATLAAVTSPRTLPPTAADGAHRCSALATLGVVGDFWTLGVLRCAVYGISRFGAFATELGIATNLLSDRLDRLVAAGVLHRVPYQERPLRHEYLLTDAGHDLTPVVLALKNWGDRHLQPGGPWTALRHRGCEHGLELVLRCPDCGTVPEDGDRELVVLRAAPAAVAGAPAGGEAGP